MRLAANADGLSVAAGLVEASLGLSLRNWRQLLREMRPSEAGHLL